MMGRLHLYMGTTKKTVKKYYPELYQWIEEQKQLQRAKIIRATEKVRIKQVVDAIKLIINNREHPSYERVVEVSGVPKKYILTHPRVRKAFEETKRKESTHLK